MQKKKRLIQLIMLMMLGMGMMACNGRDNPDSSPNAGSSSESEPAFELLMTPGPEVLQGNDALYGFEGVSFGYASSLAQNVAGSKQPAYADFGTFYLSEGPVLPDMPDYIEIKLQTESDVARVGVQPVRAPGNITYTSFSPEALQRISTIENDVLMRAGAPELVPTPPKLGYIAFQNGTGRRYLAFRPTGDNELTISNNHFFYVFEGVTDDGRFLTWFEYPIDTALLNDPDLTATLETIYSQLDDLMSDFFTPDLALLDAMATSFRIEPVETFTQSQIGASEDAGQLIITLGESNISASPDVYAVNTENNQQFTTQLPLGNGLQQVSLTVPAGPYQVFAHVPDDPNGTFLGYWESDGGSLGTVTVRGGQSSADAVLRVAEDPCGQTLPATADGKYEATNSESFQNITGCIPAVLSDRGGTYTVRPGDTLLRISRALGVDWQRIAEVNGIPSPYIIRPGETLIIPAP